MAYKHSIIYLLVLSFINVSISLQIGPLPFSARRSELIQSQSCEKSGWSCKDCSTLQSCGPDNIFKFQISCEDQFPDRPFCDPRIGQCVSDRHVCTEMKDPEFKCPDTGIYPDLTDCRRYISCRAKGEIGLIYSCLFQSVYNPIAKRCITNTNCYDPMIDCNGEFKTLAYNPDPSLYIVCRGDQKPLIKDCGNKMLEYDPSLLACDFKCKDEGRFAHPTNNSLFYICVYNENELVRMMGICRKNTVFDEFYGTCVYDFKSITTTQIPVTELETITGEEEILETTLEEIYGTTVDNNIPNIETTRTTTTTTTTSSTTIIDNEHEDETTIRNEDFEITTEDSLQNVSTSEKISTKGATVDKILSSNTNFEDITTENVLNEEITTTSNGLKESETTENIGGEITTNLISNTTNSSEESFEATETDENTKEETNENTKEETNENTKEETNENTKEETNENTKEETNENSKEETDENTKEETDENTKEDTEDTNEDNTEEIISEEETKEINSNEDENSNQNSQKTEEKDESTNDTEETKEISNYSKDEKHKCRGRRCIPNWKKFLKRNHSNK